MGWEYNFNSSLLSMEMAHTLLHKTLFPEESILQINPTLLLSSRSSLLSQEICHDIPVLQAKEEVLQIDQTVLLPYRSQHTCLLHPLLSMSMIPQTVQIYLHLNLLLNLQKSIRIRIKMEINMEIQEILVT